MNYVIVYEKEDEIKYLSMRRRQVVYYDNVQDAINPIINESFAKTLLQQIKRLMPDDCKLYIKAID